MAVDLDLRIDSIETTIEVRGGTADHRALIVEVLREVKAEMAREAEEGTRRDRDRAVHALPFGRRY